MITLLVGSIALVFWYEATDDATTRMWLEYADLVLVVFFVGEWCWRVAKNPDGPRKYAMKYSWELLGMIPLLLPVPAFLRSLRLLRVVRILRVFKMVGNAVGFFERVSQRGGLKQVGIAAGVVTIGGGTLVWLLERDDNPALAQFSDAIWWAIVTVTTVGYGDITPESVMGRFVAGILMVLGIGIFGVLAAAMASVMFDDDEEEEREHNQDQSLTDHLERLARLHRDGALTDAEFTAAKGKLLD